MPFLIGLRCYRSLCQLPLPFGRWVKYSVQGWDDARFFGRWCIDGCPYQSYALYACPPAEHVFAEQFFEFL